MAPLLVRLVTALALALTALVGFTAVAAGPANAKDLDCSDFPNQAAAQRNLNANPSDPNGLDSEGDGVACESLPCPCFYGTKNGPTPPKSKPKPQEDVLRVVKVVAGDIVRVRLGSDKPYRVHLLGIYVPNDSCVQNASKVFLAGFLGPGDKVKAIRDKRAPNRDRNGDLLRTLRYAKGNSDIGKSQVTFGAALTDQSYDFKLKSAYLQEEQPAELLYFGPIADCTPQTPLPAPS